MCGNMIGLVTFDLVLRILSGSMMRITFVSKVGSVHFYDSAGDSAGLRVPAYMIPHFKLVCHNNSLYPKNIKQLD